MTFVAYNTHLEEGKLEILQPRVYGVHTAIDKDGKPRGNQVIMLSLTMLNRGARTLAVSNISIRTEGEKKYETTFDLQKEFADFPPQQKGSFASQFSIRGKESVTRVLGFTPRNVVDRLNPGKTRPAIYALVNGKWSKYTDFTMILTADQLRNAERGTMHINFGLLKLEEPYPLIYSIDRVSLIHSIMASSLRRDSECGGRWCPQNEWRKWIDSTSAPQAPV